MKKAYFVLGWLGIVGMVAVIATITWWLLYPYNPLVIKSNYLSTDKIAYKARAILQYEVDYCKYTNLMPKVARAYEDTILYATPDTTGSRKEGCGKVLIKIDVPNLPTGTYKLRVVYTYQMNPIREVTIVKYTNPFQIIEGR